ncbi:MAG: polysaccharide export protein [Rubrivivax sp.]|nr:polysaccharide export protein [Rubrivivax sp.]
MSLFPLRSTRRARRLRVDSPGPVRAAQPPRAAARRLALQALLIGLAWFCTQAMGQESVPAGTASGWGVPAVQAPASAATAAAATASPEPAAEYRISRGDELNLRFFYTPELNTSATVRSDGRISLPLLGELPVEGLSVAELSALVERLLTPQVKRAQVAINVQGSNHLRVFVGGEVGRPGMQPLVGPLTALQAVMVAEGFKDTAQPSQALVLRRTAQGGRQVIALDLQAVMSGAQTQRDVTLQPFDVVVVPRSGIADVGRWVDLYIRRTLPVSFGLNYAIENRRGGTP